MSPSTVVGLEEEIRADHRGVVEVGADREMVLRLKRVTPYNMHSLFAIHATRRLRRRLMKLLRRKFLLGRLRLRAQVLLRLLLL